VIAKLTPDTLQAAYLLGGILTALTGVASWRLSKRAQDTAAARQQAADQGPYVESLQGWSQDVIAWYQQRAREVQDECDRALAECHRRVARLQAKLRLDEEGV
jgi:hypothetical protein